MPYKTKFFLILLLTYGSTTVHTKNGISYKLSSGRLGDQLMNYAHSLWIAMEYDLNFLYKPFKFSDQFQLHQLNNLSFECNKKDYNRQVKLTEDVLLEHDTNPSTLYIYRQFCAVNHPTNPIRKNNLDEILSIALKNPTFKKEIQNHLTPINPVKKIKFPINYVNVVLHVRVGSREDKPCTSKEFYNTLEYYHMPERIFNRTNHRTDYKTFSSDELLPSKFLPYQFYIDQLELVAEIFDDQPLFVYICTDHKNPRELVNLLSKVFHELHPQKKIIFKGHYSPRPASVIDDFKTMAQADVLIRPCSNLSRASQLYGNHKLVIYSKKASWHKDAVVVERTGIIAYNNNNHAGAELKLSTADINNKKAINNIKEIVRDVLRFPKLTGLLG